MHTHTLVAVYPTRAEAESAQSDLINIGVPENDISMSADGEADGQIEFEAPHAEKRGFWDWLFGTDIPDSDRSWYQSSLNEGRTAVCVRLSDGVGQSRAESILSEHRPLSMEGDGVSDGAGIQQTEERQTEDRQMEGETRIPVVKEQLEVGKRQTEQRHRIRVYPVERPVQEQVNLRDEEMVVEHRPIQGDGPAAGGDLEPREVEVVERHEEPVVTKKARATEEVVVRKDVKNRTETVSDTVRQTKVDVDRPGEQRHPRR